MDELTCLMQALHSLDDSFELRQSIPVNCKIGVKIVMPDQGSRYRWEHNILSSASYLSMMDYRVNGSPPVGINGTYLDRYVVECTDRQTENEQLTVWLTPAHVADGRFVKFCNDNHIPWRVVSRIPL
jgi:hypothetical protein